VNTLLNSDTEVGLYTLAAIDEAYASLGGNVLGLVPATEAGESGDGQRQAGLIQILIDLRARARAERDFARSDQIRDQLAGLGVVLEDRADGTVWKLS